MLFHTTLREIPEDGRSHIHRGGILRALNFKSFVKLNKGAAVREVQGTEGSGTDGAVMPYVKCTESFEGWKARIVRRELLLRD
jgi:hypothetical protein